MTANAILTRLWRQYIWRYKMDLLALAPVLAIVAGASASYAWILKFATDSIQSENLTLIALVPLAVIGIVTVRAAGMWGQAIMTQGLALKILRDLQSAMFAKLMSVDFARFAREDVGRLVSRFTNDITIVGYALVRAAQISTGCLRRSSSASSRSPRVRSAPSPSARASRPASPRSKSATSRRCSAKSSARRVS
jgi:subfamily B ATP-binding cassette protein MsbA